MELVYKKIEEKDKEQLFKLIDIIGLVDVIWDKVFITQPTSFLFLSVVVTIYMP